MLMKKLFSNVDIQTIKDTLSKNNVEVSDDFSFSTVNFVIGPNGSGKTRFLRAIKELYTIDGSKDVLYGYFPGLSDSKISIDEELYELPDCTLYDSMYMDDVSFADFFKEIEAHNEEFIPELLEYHSKRQKERGEKALNIVKNSFLILTGKELVIKRKKIYIKDSGDNHVLLSTALSMLSPGELMLFYMSIFLAIQQNGKKNKVIILDEPESHLHPKALISFINLLTQTYDFAEIWIATHSVFIIPEYQFENIIYISDSVVHKRTSTIYQSIFTTLLGDEEGKVRAFFSSLAQWQYCEFIAECFAKPTVIDFINPNDEQVQLFIRYLKQYTPFKVLDCGGGSGRLGLSLEAAQIGEIGNIRYDIFDKEPTYTGKEYGVFTDLNDVEGPYHCVVMMNFLHEVDPKEWQQLFSELYSKMCNGAYLLFVEVSSLLKGEMPNSQGFFVLGREELEVLFQCPHGLSEIRHKEKQKSACILIPRSYLLNVNQGTIYQAITHLQDRMLNEIKLLRKVGNVKNEKIGGNNTRHYAFLSQQYLNAKLFIDSENILSAKQLQKLIGAGKKSRKLAEVMSLVDCLWPHANSSVPDDMYVDFHSAVAIFQKHGSVPKEILNKCWKYIPLMERKHVDKDLIAASLVALTLMGETRGDKRLKNNGYIKFLPETLNVF